MKLKDSIIIILAVVIAIVVGVFVGFKLSESRIGNQETNNNKENSQKPEQNDNQNEEEKFSLSDAENLMSNYIVEFYCGDYYFNGIKYENTKDYFVFDSMTANDKNIACRDIPGISEDDLDNCEQRFHNQTVPVYLYDEALKLKKKLFGNNSTLEKRNFWAGDLGSLYYYYEQINSFVYAGNMGGGDCIVDSNKLEVYDLKTNGNSIDIYTKQTTIIQGEKKVNKNKYTFKKQDGGYYMTAVEKIN